MLEEFLQKYLKIEEIDIMLEYLKDHQRISKLKDNFFIKIGNSSNEKYFSNLKKEINLYKNNCDNNNFPKMIDYFYDDNCCVLILEKINYNTISNSRNYFDPLLSKEDKLIIINSIKIIKNIHISDSYIKDFSRELIFDKYIEKLKSTIDDNLYLSLINKKEKICSFSDLVISHGDLIGPNIMYDKGHVVFIDWEYIGYRTSTYDIAYFLLFNNAEDCFSYVDDLLFVDKNELIKDGILISMKEINNWIKLINKVEDDIVYKMIRRWEKELSILMDLI